MQSVPLLATDHWEALQYPLSNRIHDGELHDIWNGDGVKPLARKDGFLSRCNNLGLLLSTDGVPLFKSSAGSLWPVYLTIANLPPSIRANSANTLLCSLWFGYLKPPINTLLAPVVEMLEYLFTNGIRVLTPGGMKTIRAILLTGIFDLIAKAPILNMKQFNGAYGCSTCTHPGTRQCNTRVYLPAVECTPRTDETFLDAAEEAERTGEPKNGVKGKSVLSTCLDLVDGVPVDYIHAVLEGVVSWLLHAWFQSENHREPFYLGRHSREIDNLFLKQYPPHEFSRPPRSIKSHLNYWKAAEHRNWLLYYSLPILSGFLPPLYYHHYALLVISMHILLQDSINPVEIDAAEAMLNDFVSFLPELYSSRSCTMNAHLLTHLTKYVRLWGPLWTHSAFGFESKHGHLKNMIHSRSDVIDQLVFFTEVEQTLQSFHSTLCTQESERTMEFLAQMRGDAPRKNMQAVGDHTYIVGKVLEKTVDEEEARVLEISHNTTRRTFTRLFHNGTMYHSLCYQKGQGKRNSTVCTLRSDQGLEFGVIKRFVLNPEPVAIVRVFKYTSSTLLQRAGNPNRDVLKEYKRIDIANSFFHEVRPQENYSLKMFPVEAITGKAVYIDLHNSLYNYVVQQPNSYERH